MTKNPHIDSRSRALDTVNFFFLLLFTLASQFSISVTQIALALGVLTWLAKVKITKTWASQNWPLVTPITAYIIACFISVITAHNMEYSFPSLKKLLLILVFFWVINSIETLKKKEYHSDFAYLLKHPSRLIWSISILGSWGPKPPDSCRGDIQYLYDICWNFNDGGLGCGQPLDFSKPPRTLATTIIPNYFNMSYPYSYTAILAWFFNRLDLSHMELA